VQAAQVPFGTNLMRNMPFVADSIEFVAATIIANESRYFNDVALGQHADDQAETLLLALSRGAGLGGLSGMPSVVQRDGLQLHRPLLHQRGQALRQALRDAGETWIEDPSNQSPQFTRNRIRHGALPALEAALPGFAGLAARSTQHLAQAMRLLQELGEADLQTTGVPPRLAALQTLSLDRQANALRHWLHQHHRTQASTAQLAQLQCQIAACTTRGHGIEMKVGNGRVVRAAGVLTYLAD
jgi:tRNA(Ile)-lysidine synthase